MGKKRFRYRAYPTCAQGRALAQTFGCARVVFNDFVAARRDAHTSGLKNESASALLTRLITIAKRAPERAWLAEVSIVALQQAARDADQGYQDFFNSVTKKRKGALVRPPRFKSRKDNRQTARFTTRGFSQLRQTTHGVGLVYLAKIGVIRFRSELVKHLRYLGWCFLFIFSLRGQILVGLVLLEFYRRAQTLAKGMRPAAVVPNPDIFPDRSARVDSVDKG